MSVWSFKFSRSDRWQVEKKDRSYMLSRSLESNGLEMVMNSKLKKGKRKTNAHDDLKQKELISGEFSNGQRVIARDSSNGFYFLGAVESSLKRSKIPVTFDTGKKQTTRRRFIIPITGSVPRPIIRSGDHVLVAVRTRDTDQVFFIPGIVEMTPQRLEEQTRFYSVLLYNSRLVTSFHIHLFKITKRKFEYLCRTLLDKEKMKKSLYSVVQRRLDQLPALSPPSTSHRKGESMTQQRSASITGSSSSDSRSREASRSNSSSVRGSRSVSRSYSRSSSEKSSRSRSSSGSRSRSSSRSPSVHRSATKSTHVKDVVDKSTSTLDDLNETDTVSETQKALENHKEQLEQLKSRLEKQELRCAKKQKQCDNLKKKLKESKNETSAVARVSFNQVPTFEVNDTKVSSADLCKSLEIKEPSLPDYPVHILALRNSLGPLHHGTRVIAKWPLSGLYCKGVIQACHLDASYHVSDSGGNIKRIFREDILDTNAIDLAKKIDVGESVIAVHPKRTANFAPAKVIKLREASARACDVEFYDGTVTTTKLTEMFVISSRKYDYDIAYIQECENRLIGEVIVARSDDTGAFEIGQARQKVGRDGRYVVKFANGRTDIQTTDYIFSAKSERVDFFVGDKILAISDPESCKYLPGQVSEMSSHGLTVTFCDDTRRDDVRSNQSFWLSDDKFTELSAYYRDRCDGTNKD